MYTPRNFDRRGHSFRHSTEPLDTHPVKKADTDIDLLMPFYRFGPLTMRTAYEIAKSHKNYPAYRRRCNHLRRQLTTEYGTFLLHYPKEQRRSCLDIDNPEVVLSITKKGIEVVEQARGEIKHRPTMRGSEWKHGFFGNCLASSTLIGANQTDTWEYIYHDEIMNLLDGKASFDVPPYPYQLKSGETATRAETKIKLDRFEGSRNKHTGEQIIMFDETDCGTEAHESDDPQRKNYKHSLYAYMASLGNGDWRRLNFPTSLFPNTKLVMRFIFNSEVKMKTAMDIHSKITQGKGSPFIIYQFWNNFQDEFTPPKPRPELFTSEWLRVGHTPKNLSVVQSKPEQ